MKFIFIGWIFFLFKRLEGIVKPPKKKFNIKNLLEAHLKKILE